MGTIGIALAVLAGLALALGTFFRPQGLPKAAHLPLVGVLALGLATSVFNQVFFYAEPGYVYHVRTISGEEKVVSDVGFNAHFFGRYNAWKRAMTVQAVADSRTTDLNAEEETTRTSASLPPLNIMFLDQVDADAEATARFLIPTDREAFLHMAHEYRSPENLLRTALIPCNHRPSREYAVQLARIAGLLERVDEPCFHGARVKREPKAHDNRHDGKRQ